MINIMIMLTILITMMNVMMVHDVGGAAGSTGVDSDAAGGDGCRLRRPWL